MSLFASLFPGALVVFALVLFLPMTALTYFVVRRQQQQLEKLRILSILDVDNRYKRMFGYDIVQPEETEGKVTKTLRYKRAFDDFLLLSLAVLYAMIIAGFGLTLLILGKELGLSEIVLYSNADFEFPRQGSRIVVGMAFLGAYIWGLKFIFHRYAQNDILPIVYFSLGFRMLFASLVALVAFNATDALLGGNAGKNAIPLNIWPTLAFMIGMFPQRGLHWISSKIPIIAANTHPASREAPLEMIEGLSSNDILRLDELGIENCYDLATIDFIPLVLKTPYSARQIVDWILQAKLCSCFSESVIDLRKYGIRHITQLAPLTDKQLSAIAEETSVTLYALEMAKKSVENDQEIHRLAEVGMKLSVFSMNPASQKPLPEAAFNGDRRLI